MFISIAPSSAPTNITVTSLTSKELSITWAPPVPSDQNGLIREYVITLLEEYSGTLVNITVEGNISSYVFQNLHPAYTYSLEIAAITVSKGPYSDVIKVDTDEDSEYFIHVIVPMSYFCLTLHSSSSFSCSFIHNKSCCQLNQHPLVLGATPCG